MYEVWKLLRFSNRYVRSQVLRKCLKNLVLFSERRLSVMNCREPCLNINHRKYFSTLLFLANHLLSILLLRDKAVHQGIKKSSEYRLAPIHRLHTWQCKFNRNKITPKNWHEHYHNFDFFSKCEIKRCSIELHVEQQIKSSMTQELPLRVVTSRFVSALRERKSCFQSPVKTQLFFLNFLPTKSTDVWVRMNRGRRSKRMLVCTYVQMASLLLGTKTLKYAKSPS